MFQGCCHGYPWEYGIYNHQLGYKTFPIQPIEALVAVGIVLFIWLREKKKGFKVDGEAYPLMLILFGYSRFFLEFARDNEKLIWGISSLAIHALIMGIVGTVWYFTQRELNNKKSFAKHK
jgi:prolipoprotein diacylglyceryltransferase